MTEGLIEMAVATKSNKVVATRGKSVELTEAGVKALNAFNKAKKAEARAKALKEKAEAILRAELGNNTEATLEGVVALKVIASKNSHFDRKALLELYPEAYQATYQETAYTYLKTL
jgi:methylthioribose-1-phosphate isomerase